jgi:hypothetical protein
LILKQKRALVKKFTRAVKYFTAMPRREDTPLMKAVRAGLIRALGDFDKFEKADLARAGVYREKAAAYREGGTLPNGVSLIALMLALKLQLEVIDPDTGRTCTMRFELTETQMSLPLQAD